MKNKVAIIGYGYVGKGMLKIFPDALVYDPLFKVEDDGFRKEGDIIVAGKQFIRDHAGLAIICVPTAPLGNNGNQFAESNTELTGADTSIVEETVAWLGNDMLILVKSTVPPGTTDKLCMIDGGRRVAFSPEYMGEGNYYTPPQYPDPTDPRKHDFMVIGGEVGVCNDILGYFMPKLGPAKTYYILSAVEAEIVKYMENTWGAMKVTFCNEWYEICKAFGASYNKVREGWLLDSRVERMHTAIFPHKRGFGGKCYPKDLMAIIKACEEKGISTDVLKNVWETNKKMLDKNPV